MSEQHAMNHENSRHQQHDPHGNGAHKSHGAHGHQHGGHGHHQNMAGHYKARLEFPNGAPNANEETEIQIVTTDRDGNPVSRFKISHEKRIHLIIVNRTCRFLPISIPSMKAKGYSKSERLSRMAANINGSSILLRRTTLPLIWATG